jgi:hypothetical protein
VSNLAGDVDVYELDIPARQSDTVCCFTVFVSNLAGDVDVYKFDSTFNIPAKTRMKKKLLFYCDNQLRNYVTEDMYKKVYCYEF